MLNSDCLAVTEMVDLTRCCCWGAQYCIFQCKRIQEPLACSAIPAEIELLMEESVQRF